MPTLMGLIVLMSKQIQFIFKKMVLSCRIVCTGGLVSHTTHSELHMCGEIFNVVVSSKSL